jgi:DNA-binding transcriptional LysR family regulator
MDFRHLALLRELRSRGSITAVAHATHRTPSAVSQQLRTAQRELGVTLTVPHGRGLRLTEAGLLLARGADDVAEALARVRAELDEFVSAPSGSVSVLAFPSMAVALFPALAAAFADTDIRVELHDRDAAEAEFAALTDDFDIVLAHSLGEAPPRGAQDRKAVLLGTEPLDAAMSADHPLAARSALTAEDLGTAEWIGVPEGFPFDRVLRAAEVATGARIRVAQRVRDNALVEALVAGTRLLAILPRFTTRTDGGIVLRPIRGLPAGRRVWALMRADTAARSAVQTVIEELRAAFDQAMRSS